MTQARSTDAARPVTASPRTYVNLRSETCTMYRGVSAVTIIVTVVGVSDCVSGGRRRQSIARFPEGFW
jgi:hypothetical protein